MRRYHSDNKNYNAILDAMAEIRHNQLNEGYYAEAEHEDEEMAEGMHGDEEEMAEQMDDEEAEAIAEMMDEALYEMDMEDDEDNLNEADGDRKQRRRNRLRQALLIGAGLAAAGLGGTAYALGRGARQPGPDAITGNKSGLGGILQDLSTGTGIMTRRTPEIASDVADAAVLAGKGLSGRIDRAMNPNPKGGARSDYGRGFAGRSPQYSPSMDPNSLARRLRK